MPMNAVQGLGLEYFTGAYPAHTLEATDSAFTASLRARPADYRSRALPRPAPKEAWRDGGLHAAGTVETGWPMARVLGSDLGKTMPKPKRHERLVGVLWLFLIFDPIS